MVKRMPSYASLLRNGAAGLPMTVLKSCRPCGNSETWGIEWRKERAGRNFGRFRPIGRLMRPERAPSRARMSRTASGGDGGGHRLDAKDVERAAQIVGERRQAELGAHVGEAAHQEGALIHPLLDAAEGMLNDLATTVENLRPLLQALGHAIEHGLVFEARTERTSFVHRARIGQSRQ